MAISITLNGQAVPLDAEMSIRELLAQLDFGGKPVVVEHNEQPVFPREYDQCIVRDGSRVELVMLAAGG